MVGKYLIIKATELGDQFECDAYREPVCITDDYSKYLQYGYDIYTIEKNGELTMIKDYDSEELGVEVAKEPEKDEKQEKIDRYQRYIKNKNNYIDYLMIDIKQYRKTLSKSTTKRMDYWKNKIKEVEAKIQKCKNDIAKYQKEIEKIA